MRKFGFLSYKALERLIKYINRFFLMTTWLITVNQNCIVIHFASRIDLLQMTYWIRNIITLYQWIIRILETTPICFLNSIKSFSFLSNWNSKKKSSSSHFKMTLPSLSLVVVNARKTDFGLQFSFWFQITTSICLNFSCQFFWNNPEIFLIWLVLYQNTLSKQ